MKMPGAADPAYVVARRVLLDTLDALSRHLDALILVGAQAIYLHTGAAEFAIAEYTTDADLVIDPGLLKPDPLLAEALRAAGFYPSPKTLGTWLSAVEGVGTDLMVPDAIATGGRRSADLGVHGDRVARKARGLEATLVDHSTMTIGALEETDPRRHEVHVAGPAALLVAKLHKIADRRSDPRRQDDKDAYDVYRILQARETDELARTIAALRSDARAANVTYEAIGYLGELFGSPTAQGAEMVARTVGVLGDASAVAQSVAFLSEDLLQAVNT